MCIRDRCNLEPLKISTKCNHQIENTGGGESDYHHNIMAENNIEQSNVIEWKTWANMLLCLCPVFPNARYELYVKCCF